MPYKSKQQNKEDTKKLLHSHGFNPEILQDEFNVIFKDDKVLFKETEICVPMTYHSTYKDKALRKSNKIVVDDKKPNELVEIHDFKWAVNLDTTNSSEIEGAIDYLKEISRSVADYPLLDEGLMCELELEEVFDNMEMLLRNGFNHTFNKCPVNCDKLRDYLTDLDAEVGTPSSLRRICEDSCNYYGEIYLSDKFLTHFKDRVNELIEQEIDRYYDSMNNILTLFKSYVKSEGQKQFTIDIENNEFANTNLMSVFQHIEDVVTVELDEVDYKYVFVNNMIEFDYRNVNTDNDDCSIHDVTKFKKNKAKEGLTDAIMDILEKDIDNEAINEYAIEFRKEV